MNLQQLKQNPALIIVAGVALVMLLLGAMIFIPATDEGSRRLGLFLTILSPITIGMFNLITSTIAANAATASHHTVTKIEGTTDALVNGVMDEKIRTVVTEVLHEELPDALMAHDVSVHDFPAAHLPDINPAAP